jgi:hypothetical protein
VPATAAALVLGDLHVGQEDPEVIKATKDMTGALVPTALVLHDVLDMSSRSHHKKSLRDSWDGRHRTVQHEVHAAAHALDDMTTWGAGELFVVRSNHDEHLERFLEEFDPRKDPINAPYWHSLWVDAYDYKAMSGKWPDLFAMEVQNILGDPEITFLGREDTVRIAGVNVSCHGDAGINGSRGSIRQYAKLGIKSVIGHSHTPGWFQGCVQVGVTGKLDMGYNSKPSSWAHAHCVVHADGKRQLVFVIDGRWRGGK